MLLRPRKTHVAVRHDPYEYTTEMLAAANDRRLPAIPAGDRLTFRGLAGGDCRLDDLLFVSGYSGAFDDAHGAGLRLHSMRIGEHEYPFAACGPEIVNLARAMSNDVRNVTANETIFLTIENDGRESAVVNPVLRCTPHAGAGPVYMSTHAVGQLCLEPQRFTLDRDNEYYLRWEPPWRCIPKRIYAKTDAPDRLQLKDMHVQNTHMLGHGSLPIALFVNGGADIGCVAIEVGHSLGFIVRNSDPYEPHWIEFELDVDAFDPRDPKCRLDTPV